MTEIEISSTQMVMCIKLISFAWSVYDGGRPDAELDATQRASALREVPDLISFMGYWCVSRALVRDAHSG